MSLYGSCIWCPISPLYVTVWWLYLVSVFTFRCHFMVVVLGVFFHLCISLYGSCIWCPLSPLDVTVLGVLFHLYMSLYLVTFFTFRCHCTWCPFSPFNGTVCFCFGVPFHLYVYVTDFVVQKVESKRNQQRYHWIHTFLKAKLKYLKYLKMLFGK